MRAVIDLGINKMFSLKSFPTRTGKIINVILSLTGLGMLASFAYFLGPEIPSVLGLNNTKTIKVDDNSWVEFPKATFARACDEYVENCTQEDVILLSGVIDTGTLNRLKSILETDRGKAIQTICLSSIGGYNRSAVELIDIIKQKGMNTCLALSYKINTDKYLLTIASRRCESACGLVFLAGTKRQLVGSGFHFGVHSSGLTLGGSKVTFNDEAYSGSIRTEHKELFEFSRTIDAAKMYYLSTDEANKYHVFSEPLTTADKKTARLLITKCAGIGLNHNCLSNPDYYK